MKQPANMCAVRNRIVSNVGKRVKVMSNRGRNRVDITEGIISETYPCLFLIQVRDEYSEETQTISYTYSDVLTKEIELVLC